MRGAGRNEKVPCFLCTGIIFCQNKNVETYKIHLVEKHNVLTNLKVVISWTLLDSSIDKELKEALSLINSAQDAMVDIMEVNPLRIATENNMDIDKIDFKIEDDNFDCYEEMKTSFDHTNEYDIDINIKEDDSEDETG